MTPVILQFKPVDHRRVLTIFREVSFHYLKLINIKAQAEIFWEKWEQILERGVRRIIVWYSKIPHEDRGDKLLSFWVRILLIFKDSEKLNLHQSWLAHGRKLEGKLESLKILGACSSVVGIINLPSPLLLVEIRRVITNLLTRDKYVK